MSEADQDNPGQQSPPEGQSVNCEEQAPVSKYELLPSTEPKDEKELFSFRESMMLPPQEPATEQNSKSPAPVAMILLLLVGLACIAAFVLASPSLFGPKRPAYVDLGSQRFDPAGLSGRLIARWENNASYQLFLDPSDPEQMARFAAVAQDPPRQLAVTIRLRDDAGLIVCQKQILLPAPEANAPGADSTPPGGPQQTQTGDTVQNMTGEDGRVGEIDLTGPLPCSADAYAAFKSWDFFTSFPTLAEQEEWLRQEKAQNGKGHGSNPSIHIEHLSTAIESDDVIVADNPSHGTVETSGGRIFFLGSDAMRSRGAEWQVFPARIHFSCDKNGACILTRANSRVSLHARLLR